MATGGPKAAAARPKASKNKVAGFGADEDTVGKKDPEITGIMVVNGDVTKFVPVRAGIASETMLEVSGEVKEGTSSCRAHTRPCARSSRASR
jgi:hypothetical protein